MRQKPARLPLPAAPLLTKAGPRSWHTPRPAELARILTARPDLHGWEPDPDADVRRAEVARLYHKPPGASWVVSSCLVISFDGWCRVSGDDPARCGHILDDLAALAAEAAAQAAPVEAAPRQLGLFGAVEGVA